jgi:tetratricopeptide (TPR) repeat protein
LFASAPTGIFSRMSRVARKTRQAAEAIPPASFPWLVLLQISIMVAAAVWIFGPALSGGGLWDDDVLVTTNFNLHSLHGLWEIWVNVFWTDYWPLSWTLFWVEWQLWGNALLGYHIVTLALHLVDGLLVWHLLRRLGVGWAWVGGLIFVVHPLTVETVAWVAETKNTFSVFFFLLSVEAWLDHDEGGRLGYFLSVFFYLTGMLCKSSVIMLPFVLLLYGWWKHGRVGWRDMVKTVPYFAVAVVLGLISFYMQNRNPAKIGANAIPYDTPLHRILGASLEVFFYLGKYLVPTGLLPIYPRWILDQPSWLEWLAPLLLAAAVGLVWHWRRVAWVRLVALGLGFFLLMGLPTFGLVNMLYLRISRVADHLIYLPMIGLIGLTVAGLEAASARLPVVARGAIPLALAVVLVLFAWEGHVYSGYFTDQEKLWVYTVARNPDAWPAQNDLGLDLLNEGHLDEAAVHFREALRIKPDYAEAHNNLGLVYLREGLGAKAPAGRIEAAVPIAPGHPSPPVSPPGGDFALAAAEFRNALQIKPGYDDARNNLALALQHNQDSGAIGQYEETLQAHPDDIDTRNDLGLALLQAARVPEAIAQFQEVLRARPDYIDARNNLGLALLQTARAPEAIKQFQQALRTKPEFAEAHNNLGLALAQTGRLKEAIAQYQLALRYRPDYPDARNNLYLAQQQALRQTAVSKK